MSNTTQVDVKIDGDVATLSFVSEKGFNIGSADMLTSLQAACEKVAAEKGVRLAIIRGEGKVFLAGADIKAMHEFNSDAARDFSQLGHNALNALETLPCMTVACIQSAALGGGCEVALACDFRIVTRDVKIGLPETSLGLIPGWAGTQRLGKLIGLANARRMIFGAKPLDAEAAKRISLVDEVVESADDLVPAAKRFFANLNRGGPRAISLAKRAMRDGKEVEAFADCFKGAEAKEGMGAFVQKRPANWMETR